MEIEKYTFTQKLLVNYPLPNPDNEEYEETISEEFNRNDQLEPLVTD